MAVDSSDSALLSSFHPLKEQTSSYNAQSPPSGQGPRSVPRALLQQDNAPAHRQTEARVTERENLELLRLGPYSPMCNPIEGCFSVLKARIKAYLTLCRDEMLGFPNGEKTEGRMRLLERAVMLSWHLSHLIFTN
ncbi:hypothetical protein PC113_g17879 [Phytophthora cactorum]|uniref:Tc1-like transposase DDE domain-containing protein n=1 Tax=Phytophthora cactorum TaxID=29920 RepID=A0A8T0YRZ1_9STRA|nr:hypothetical protein PC113_g17879 [Phytophthora cactorum]